MNAFWVKGKEVIDLGYDRHVHYIIKNPEKFGLTKVEISKIYKKHKEKLFSEGNAREELIKLVANSGWIRVREYPNYVSIQFDKYRLRKKTVQDFIYWAVYSKKLIPRNQTLVLTGYEDGYQEKIQASPFLEERKVLRESRQKTNFTIVYDIES